MELTHGNSLSLIWKYPNKTKYITYIQHNGNTDDYITDKYINKKLTKKTIKTWDFKNFINKKIIKY